MYHAVVSEYAEQEMSCIYGVQCGQLQACANQPMYVLGNRRKDDPGTFRTHGTDVSHLYLLEAANLNFPITLMSLRVIIGLGTFARKIITRVIESHLPIYLLVIRR